MEKIMKKLLLFTTIFFLISVNASEKNYLVDDITDENVCVVSYVCSDEHTIQDPDDPDLRYKWFLPADGERDYNNGGATRTRFGGIFEIKEDGTKELVSYCFTLLAFKFLLFVLLNQNKLLLEILFLRKK